MQANIIKRLVHQKRHEEECSGEGDVDEGRSQGVWERAVRGNVPRDISFEQKRAWEQPHRHPGGWGILGRGNWGCKGPEAGSRV